MRAALCLLLLTGCAAPATHQVPAGTVMPFSAGTADSVLPPAWQPLIISRAKSPTEYRLVRDPIGGEVVLHATADSSASGLRQRLAVDPNQFPVVRWRWRVIELIVGADNQDRYSEDSPVRLMLFFDGDKGALPLKERLLMETAQLLTGEAPPFATLMYIWENRFPVDTVLANSYTDQIQMIVAGSGRDANQGEWKILERNYFNDYRRVFGDPPGQLIGVGIMTDTDNTGERIEAFYGDIELRRGH